MTKIWLSFYLTTDSVFRLHILINHRNSLPISVYIQRVRRNAKMTLMVVTIVIEVTKLLARLWLSLHLLETLLQVLVF